MKMRSIFSSLLAVALLIGLTTSCEDEFNTMQDGVKTLKTTVVDGAFDLVHSDFVNQEEEFTVSFEAQCGVPVLEMWNGEAWATVATGDCETTEFTTVIDDYGVYSLRVSLTLGECECEFVPLTSDVINITVCRKETAFAVDLDELVWDSKKAWWYVFDVSAYDPLAEIPVLSVDGEIWADQDVMIGTIVYNGSTLEIALEGEWILNPDCIETVKVQGYDTEPSGKRPTAGKMDLKGDLLTVDVSNYVYDFYVVHMDVKTCDVPYYGIELIN